MITYYDHDGHDYRDDMSGETYYKDRGVDHRDDDTKHSISRCHEHRLGPGAESEHLHFRGKPPAFKDVLSTSPLFSISVFVCEPISRDHLSDL